MGNLKWNLEGNSEGNSNGDSRGTSRGEIQGGGEINRQMREEAIADLSSRSGGELRQCEECGVMRVAAGDSIHGTVFDASMGKCVGFVAMGSATYGQAPMHPHIESQICACAHRCASTCARAL